MFPIVTPYHPHARDLIPVRGAIATWAPGDIDGERTIQVLKLNRPELLVSRARRIESVARLLERWVAAGPDKRDVARVAVQLDYEEGDYPSAVADYLISKGFPLAE